MRILSLIGLIFSLIMLGIGLYDHESATWLYGWEGSSIWAACTFIALIPTKKS